MITTTTTTIIYIQVSHIDHGIPEPHQMALFKSSSTHMDGGMMLQEESKEEWEQRMLQAEGQRKLNRRKAFLQDMQKTYRSFNREHDYIKRCREQICKAVRMWHRNAEKSKEKERAERLQALKSNDFEKYREFVKEAKNERYTHNTHTHTLSLSLSLTHTHTHTHRLMELIHRLFLE